MSSLDPEYLEQLKVTELKAELASRQLDNKGNKAVLVKRLKDHLLSGESSDPEPNGDALISEDKSEEPSATTEENEETMEETPSSSEVKNEPELSEDTTEQESEATPAPDAAVSLPCESDMKSEPSSSAEEKTVVEGAINGIEEADTTATVDTSCTQSQSEALDSTKAALDAEKKEQDDHPLAENSHWIVLTKLNFPLKSREILVPLLDDGTVRIEDFEDKTLEVLRSLKPQCLQVVVDQFLDSCLIGVENKAPFLGLAARIFKDRAISQGEDAACKSALFRGPSKEKLQEILDRTGYSLDVTIGQRKYGGPPPDFDDVLPPGTELYIGSIPRDVYEDELIPLLETHGKLYDVRVMVDPASFYNKGFAFATFTTREAADAAVKELNGFEIRNSRLKVNQSIANTRLFVGNIPKSKTKEAIMEEMSGLSEEEIKNVIIYTAPDRASTDQNRGFCFLEFKDHKAASAAKKRLTRSRPWGREVMIDWADIEEEVDSEEMAKVKILFVTGLKANITEAAVREVFEKYGELEHVTRMKHFAFVHFTERESAVKALEECQGYEFEGTKCEVTLAKPKMDKQKRGQIRKDRERRQMFMRQDAYARGAGRGNRMDNRGGSFGGPRGGGRGGGRNYYGWGGPPQGGGYGAGGGGWGYNDGYDAYGPSYGYGDPGYGGYGYGGPGYGMNPGYGWGGGGGPGYGGGGPGYGGRGGGGGGQFRGGGGGSRGGGRFNAGGGRKRRNDDFGGHVQSKRGKPQGRAGYDVDFSAD